MPMTKHGWFAVRTPEEWGLVSSDTWAEVFETLAAGDALSAREIADRLGRTRQNIYFHLRKLENAGLLRVASKRKGVKRPEAVYALTTIQIRLEYQPDDQDSVERFIHAYAALFRAASRDFAASARAGRLTMDRDGRDWVAFRDVARLTHDQAVKVRGLLEQVDAIMNEGRQANEGELWTVFAASMPITRP